MESKWVPEIMCSSNVPITSRPPYTLSRSGSLVRWPGLAKLRAMVGARARVRVRTGVRANPNLIRRTADEWGFV